MVKNQPARQETRETGVLFLGLEDPLQEQMETHSSIFAWKKSCGQGRLAGYNPWGHKESDTTERLSTQIPIKYSHELRTQ